MVNLIITPRKTTHEPPSSFEKSKRVLQGSTDCYGRASLGLRVIDEGFENFVSVWCFLLRALGPSFYASHRVGEFGFACFGFGLRQYSLESDNSSLRRTSLR